MGDPISRGSSAGSISLGGGNAAIEIFGTLENFGTSDLNVTAATPATTALVTVSGPGALLNLGSTTTGAVIGGNFGGEEGAFQGALSIVSGGAMTLGAGGLVVGDGGTGSVVVSGANSRIISQGTSALIVGLQGSGLMTIDTGGEVSSTAQVVIGDGPIVFGDASQGTVTVGGTGATAGGTLITAGLAVGSEGAFSGVLNVLGGGQVTNTGSFGIGITDGQGFVTVDAGTLTVGSNSFLIGVGTNGGGGTGLGNLLLENSGSVSFSDGMTPGQGEVTLLSGGMLSDLGSADIDIGQSSLLVSATIVVNGGTFSQTEGGFFVGGTSAGAQVTLRSGVLTTGGASSLTDISATGGSLAAASVSGGTWTVNGELIVGDTGAGTLSMTGGTINAGSNNIVFGNQSGGDGVSTITGSGVSLEGGTLLLAETTGADARLAVDNQASVVVSGVSIGAGGLLLLGGGQVTAGTASNIGIVSGNGTFSGTLTNNGTVIAANSGVLDITGGLNGSGTGTIDSAATLETVGTALANAISFASNVDNAALQLDTTLNATESFQLTNWQQGDALILNIGSTISNAQWLNPGTDVGTLAVTTSGGTFDFTNVTVVAGADVTPQFTFSADAVTLMSCFAPGTLIELDRGPAAVEHLSVGDVALTHDGEPEPIIWIGSRTIDCARHPKPATVWPVRIAAGAFGPGTPARDLYLSPDHAVFVDGVLVPAKLLINGETITQVKRASVTYHHIELSRHAVILAERLAVESYLDTGDRARFSGDEVIALYPEFVARAWEMAGCAELVTTGARLAAIRASLRPRLAVAG